MNFLGNKLNDKDGGNNFSIIFGNNNVNNNIIAKNLFKSESDDCNRNIDKSENNQSN